MKKGFIVAFLFPVFFMTVIAYAGDIACNKKQPGASNTSTHAPAYANIDQDTPSAIFAANHYCPCAAPCCIQKILNSNENYLGSAE
jgi:hypothetical protein